MYQEKQNKVWMPSGPSIKLNLDKKNSKFLF